MSWVTILWSMIASACLTIAAIHFMTWCHRRTAWADLSFSVMSTAVAFYAVIELAMMRAQTPAAFAVALRWLHVPTWAIVLSIVVFVRLHMGVGRLWLAWSIGVVRTLVLCLNFLVGDNLNYLKVTQVQQIRFLSETVSIGKGVANPWMLLGQLSLLLWFAFVTDATIAVWRRGDHRQALITGGSLIVFAMAGVVQSVLVLWQIVQAPLTASVFYLFIVVAMGYDKSRETLRAAQLSDELRESEAQMTLAAEAAGFGVWMWTVARDRFWASERWRRLFGFDPGQSLTFEMFIQRIHSDDRARVESAIRQALTDHAGYTEEYRVQLPDGTERWVSSRGKVYPNGSRKPGLLLGASIDITDRKHSEEEIARQRNELAHLSRVTTLSELSSSLAHEINQPLAIILTNAQAAQRLLTQNPPDLAEASDILADIVSEDQRAGEVIRRLRALLKPGQIDLQPLSANDIVDDVLRVARSDLIGRGVTVHTVLAENLPDAVGDRIQLQQVLLNLILNSCDAMAANPPMRRRLTLSTAFLNGMVRVSVSDTGCGLSTDPDSIFKPFYTTKKDGLGLGLSICRSIVSAHTGRLWAEPTPPTAVGAAGTAAGGATLHLELPVVRETKS
ncbi:MAG TPA: ATP-binding protein [Phycisphaerae bacterium]|nr:ATP-binding protein [Phycisphaerae bacterium]